MQNQLRMWEAIGWKTRFVLCGLLFGALDRRVSYFVPRLAPTIAANAWILDHTIFLFVSKKADGMGAALFPHPVEIWKSSAQRILERYQHSN
jgi:hypothetical protein